MSETNDRKPKHAVQAEQENAAVEVQAANEDKEQNAEAVKAEAPAKKSKKKRKARGIAVQLVAVLLVLALGFGLVVGYTLGRNVGADRLVEALGRVDELTAALEEARSAPVYDAFHEELTGENQQALSELAGSAFEGANIASELMGEDALLGLAGENAAESVVVAEFEGGQLMSDAVSREYSEQLAALVLDGYNAEEIADTLLDEVLKYMVSDHVLEAKAREMGLYELTDADNDLIDAQAEREYAEQLDFARMFVNTQGMTEEEATGALKSYLMETEGLDYAAVRQNVADGWWAQKMYDKITGDIQMDESRLQEAYEAGVLEQRESYESYPDAYELAQMNGEVILYNLPGYRAVRMLLLGFENPEALEAVSVMSEEISELDPEKDAEEIAAYRAEIDSFYAAEEARAQAVLNEINAGASFAELLAELGEDKGMQDEYLRNTGYYISAESLLWSPEMVDAAMALKTPGEISGLVRTGEGVCILEYVGEVTAGAVALEDVRDVLGAQVLEAAREEAYHAQLDAWVAEAKPVYYPERMQ